MKLNKLTAQTTITWHEWLWAPLLITASISIYLAHLRISIVDQGVPFSFWDSRTLVSYHFIHFIADNWHQVLALLLSYCCTLTIRSCTLTIQSCTLTIRKRRQRYHSLITHTGLMPAYAMLLISTHCGCYTNAKFLHFN